MDKSLFFFIIWLLVSFNSNAQDTLVIRNNNDKQEILVKILKVNQEELEYKDWSDLNGRENTISIDKIYSIKYQNGEIRILNLLLFKSKKRHNAVFIGFGGLSYFVSLNYERKLFYTKKLNFFAMKIGAASFHAIKYIYVVSSALSYNLSFEDNHKAFEFGVGGGYYNTGSANFDYMYITPTLGYRSETDQGLLFKFYFSVLTIAKNNPAKFDYYPFVGVDLGVSF